MVGKTLGHYEILEPLGAGGMGEVYRARDTKLDRDVAIKVLPEDFAKDGDRLARFEREAKLLASLNHANIAAIFGLEDESDQRFIAMELVDGETLAERIARSGRIEIDEALEIARQIAEALEAAHYNGVIHRDLKPANVIVSPNGTAKVLDFGLAKAHEADGSPTGYSPDLSNSPTITAATRTGVILGTAAYMSPEQAKGKVLDRRTDVWSLGCVCYEMLTGVAAFRGEGVSETLAAILKDEPNWDALPEGTPPEAIRLLRRCLNKDARYRLHDVADARISIEEAIDGPEESASERGPVVGRHHRPRLVVALVALAVLASASLAWNVYQLGNPPTTQTQILVALPPDVALPIVRGGYPDFDITPDGSAIVYRSEGMLHLKPMGELRGEPIAGTESVSAGFAISPSGAWIAYFHEGSLWRIETTGGTPLEIAQTQPIRGLTWVSDETLVIGTPGAPDGSAQGLRRVEVSSGEVSPLTSISEDDDVTRSHRWPGALPGGDAIVFSMYGGADADNDRIGVVSLEGGPVEILPVRGTYPRYAMSGHLLFARGGSLLAVAFEADTGRVLGQAIPLADSVLVDAGGAGHAHYALSTNGTLLWAPEPAPRSLEPVLVDSEGGVQTLGVRPGPYAPFVRFSPDGEEIVFSDSDVHSYNLRTGAFRPLFPEAFNNRFPVFAPDGVSLLYASNRYGGFNILRRRVDGSGSVDRLTEGTAYRYVNSVSHDGGLVLYQRNQGPGWDLYYGSLNGDLHPTELVVEVGHQSQGVVSPDGRLFAYTSNDSGTFEVYVSPFPEATWRELVSVNGGSGPVWRFDGGPAGGELLFVSGGSVVVAPITIEPAFRIGERRELFDLAEGLLPGTSAFPRGYDLSPVGDRFVFMRAVEDAEAAALFVKLHLFEELKARVPGER